MPTITFHRPNNPIQTTLDMAVACEQEADQWCCEPKGDGWRRPVYKINEKWISFAKASTGAEASTTPPDSLMKELELLDFPEGTAFDAEWMGPRAVKHTQGKHWFVLYDLLYFGGQWQGDTPYRERRASMETLIIAHKTKLGLPTPHIMVGQYVKKNFVQCYQQQKTNPLTEGIVLKRWDSPLLVNGGDNPGWLKIKYRQ